jgi:hypothetical protein
LVTASRVDSVFAPEEGMYTVQVTNLINTQRFTPILAATHTGRARLFKPGTRATPELRALSEGGDTGRLTVLLTGPPAAVREVGSTSGLLRRGGSVTFKISGGGGFDQLSLASMLISTNDAFVALQATLPDQGERKVVYAYTYDAGTEQNDELYSSIQGPFFRECGGPGGGAQVGNGEGVVIAHSGIHGVGDLLPHLRDWGNPVARITIWKVI